VRFLVLLSFLFGAQMLQAAPPTTGTASFYGDELRGRKMANGKPFDPDKLTCASWFYPLGTILKVQHEEHTVYVEVTDRGPARRLVAKGRIIDLSDYAFRCICDPEKGLCDVVVTPVLRIK
jgi:rare lipoprotein A